MNDKDYDGCFALIFLVAFIGISLWLAIWAPCWFLAYGPAKDMPGRCVKELVRP